MARMSFEYFLENHWIQTADFQLFTLARVLAKKLLIVDNMGYNYCINKLSFFYSINYKRAKNFFNDKEEYVLND